MKKDIDNKEKSDFIKAEALKLERNNFILILLIIVAGYIGITFWLSAIRASASLWFVWVLIVIQLGLYLSIFVVSWGRAVVCGLNKVIAGGIITGLTILGRVENWEIIIIPLFIIIILIFSARNNNINPNGRFNYLIK